MPNHIYLSLFCRNLHALRLRHGLSLADMADLLQVTAAELAAVESGTVPRSVTVEILVQIHKKFGIRPGQMFSSDF